MSLRIKKKRKGWGPGFLDNMSKPTLPYYVLTPNAIEASASSKKKKEKIQYPVPCQKYPRQDAKKSVLTAWATNRHPMGPSIKYVGNGHGGRFKD